MVADTVIELALNTKKARLYNDNSLTYGQMTTLDEFGQEMKYLFVVADVILKMTVKDIYNPIQGYTTISQSINEDKAKNKNYKIVLFTEGTNTLKQISETERNLIQ